MSIVPTHQEDGDIAALVRRVRAQRGLTQEGLASALGVSFATVNGWENNRHRPIPALARKLEELAFDPHRARPPAHVPPRGTSSPESQELVSRAGWAPEAKERRDFYHRAREFPPDVMRWRNALVDAVLGAPDVYGSTEVRAARKADEAQGVEATRALVDAGVSYLREIARLLGLLHGTTPRHKDPVDQIVFAILSKGGREQAADGALSSLKSSFRTWDDVLGAKQNEVEARLSPHGVEAKTLLDALSVIRDTFGSCTIMPADGWAEEQLESALTSIPGIDSRRARTLMVHGFGRSAFPMDATVARVLIRLRPYRELGLNLQALRPNELEKLLGELIPPNLRRSLHLNLSSHGREICRAQKPLCGECELRNFCSDYRDRERVRVESLEQPRTIDLFTGAGGLSEGFERAGFQVAAALDIDPVALRTYWLNHPSVPDERILCRDIREVPPKLLKKMTGPRPIDVLLGAPPCQGFSHVGFRSKSSLTGYRVTGDERNFLYTYMVEVARELRPRLFLMENVPGMKSAKKGDLSFLDAAAEPLRAAGYETAIWKLNAAAYGVPQDRIRCFLVGARGAPVPKKPPEQYQDTTARQFDPDALPAISFDEAVFDLPARAADDGAVVELWSDRQGPTDPRYRRYLTKFGLLTRSRFVFNHTVRYHNERDLELYALLRPGEDSVHALERHGRADLMRYRTDVFDDKYGRLRGDKPCKTIVAHLAKDGNGYIHPTQVRSISFREAARIQSFRDDYMFCGAPTDQWVQLGNAVPPVLGEAIARSFHTSLEAPRRTK